MKINNSDNVNNIFTELANAKRNYYSTLLPSETLESETQKPETDVFVPSRAKQPDKKERIITSLLDQRDKFEDYKQRYFLYMKHTPQIKPTKEIREAIINNKKLVITKTMINLDITLLRSKIPEPVTVYRCGNPLDFGLQMETDEFIQRFYKEGEYFRIPIYPRTTLRKGFAKQYIKCCHKAGYRPILYKINLPANTRGLYLDELEDENPVIKNQNEQEIFLQRNKVFRFKNHSSHRYYEKIEIDKVPRWKVPFWKKIHDFGKEANLE